MSINTVEKLSEHDVKIEKMIFYQGSNLHQEEFKDLVGSYYDEELSEIFGESIIDLADGEILEYMDQNYVGWFMAEVHTPKKTLAKGGALSWSWGLTTYTLILAPTFKEIVDKSCKWAKKKENEFRKKGK